VCTAPCPALVVVHGTSGINTVGAFYREPLVKAGIAFFEVDFKTGVFTSPMNRPAAETFVPMGFAAHLAFYPVCRTFVSQGGCRMTGAPMIVFYGTADSYGEGKYVPEFKSKMKYKYKFDMTTVEYPGAAHAFNRNEPA
jgi:hypothetical protein